VRVALEGGGEGWGEIASLPPVTAHDQPAAIAAVGAVADVLLGRDAGAWRALAGDLEAALSDAPSVRAGLEVALLDALTRAWGVPLWRFFGGASDHIETDVTIPIAEPAEAGSLAAEYRGRGFRTLKVKVGRAVDADLERLRAIASAHRDARLVLDANEGYTADEALALVRGCRAAGIELALLEQPVAREDAEGMARLAREAGVPVAADESCATPEDALRIARDGLAQVVNIKLSKSGVVRALEIAAVARAAGLGLMVGEMVETRLSTGFAAHFAAGLGGFEWVDLDTPLLLAEDPVRGGYTAEGPRYDLGGIEAGHGAWLEA
jgi:L-alanine-DL-glutamate epimerase-like enolase superfamily enzyme